MEAHSPSSAMTPCSETLKTIITQEHTEFMELRTKLRSYSWISIALDHWTCVTNHSWLGICAQWIDGKFDYDWAVIGFIRDANHQAFWAAATVEDILADVLPSYKTTLAGVVGDATNPMVATLKRVAALNSQYGFYSVCFAHVLQKAIVKAFEKVQAINSYHNLQKCCEFY